MKYIKLFENDEWIEDWEEEDENDYEDYPRNFKKFLIKHGALEKYHKNFLRCHTIDYLKIFFMDGLRMGLISEAFGWGNSPEKFQYWKTLSTYWGNIFRFNLHKL